jgi:hypothetical protein
MGRPDPLSYLKKYPNWKAILDKRDAPEMHPHRKHADEAKLRVDATTIVREHVRAEI